MIDQPIKNNVREVLEQLHILDLNLKPVIKQDKSELENTCIITDVRVDSARFVINQAEDLINCLFSCNDPRNKLTYAKMRKVLDAAIKVHQRMCESEYDRGFQYGMEHALFLIDSLANDEWQKVLKKYKEEKENDI